MNTSWEADDSATEISLAPLIDCVFLLLIFFLLATTFTSEEKEHPMLNLAKKRLPLDLPPSDASLEKDAVLAEMSGLLIQN